ncbi:hypothetical protein LTR95_014291 [Oleoguttula sp. CCFEE 5521]
MSHTPEKVLVDDLSLNTVSETPPRNHFERRATETQVMIYNEVFTDALCTARPPECVEKRRSFGRSLMSLLQVCRSFRNDAYETLAMVLGDEADLCDLKAGDSIPKELVIAGFEDKYEARWETHHHCIVLLQFRTDVRHHESMRRRKVVIDQCLSAVMPLKDRDAGPIA